jgi:hypothetical protein
MNQLYEGLFVAMDNADLPGLLRIGPVGTIENGRTRLHKGEIVSAKDENANNEQFERSFPGMLRGRGLQAAIDDLGPEAAAGVPALCSGCDAVGAVDQLQARL